MDASKLRNSCICGNTVPYLDCCGRFADPVPAASPEVPARIPKSSKTSRDRLRAKTGLQPSLDVDGNLNYAFYHTLHELSLTLFPLRAIYQAYWDKLKSETYPHEMLMENADYGRSIVENFFWDYFVQYSDARPILRTAREIEAKDLRLAHDLMKWAFVPLWFYRVQERNAGTAKLLNLGNNRIHTVHHAGAIPEAGSGVLTRILPFRGVEFCGHASLALAPGDTPTHLDALFRAGCRELGLKPSVTLRPDVHCEEWRRHGAVFLGLWRAEIFDSKVGRPANGSGAAPILNFSIRDREPVMQQLAAHPETVPIAAGIWDLKFRSLRLARLEPRGGKLLVTLADAAFRNHVTEWLQTTLGQAASLIVESQEALPGAGSESQDVWIHTALDALNAQTPIQASTHDWGRRRLQALLNDLMKQGVDITSLRRQLGI